MRILVVDDDETNRMVVKLLMEMRGHSVAEADSGMQALDQLSDSGADVVLMDLQMPEMDGFETTRRLRASGGLLSQTPIVALSAHTSQRDRQLCDQAGMDGFLEKPFNAEKAETMIRMVRARTSDERSSSA